MGSHFSPFFWKREAEVGRCIASLPPDNASLMRYIYLKLCISSPCQGLRARPRLPPGLFRISGAGPRPAGSAATSLPAASLGAAWTVALCAPAPSHRPGISAALWLGPLACPLARCMPSISLVPAHLEQCHSRRHSCFPRPRAEPEGRTWAVPLLSRAHKLSAPQCRV